MIHFQSRKWRVFVSRPTSILKRDFLKLTYLSIGKIKGFRLTKILAIGDGQEMDVYVDNREDQANYSQIVKQYKNEEVREVFKVYDYKISHYRPIGEDAVSRSLRAMKDMGPIVIYSYYIERFLDRRLIGKSDEKLLATNTRLRDGAAKIFYPLYDKARRVLQKKYKNGDIDCFTLSELDGDFNKTTARRRKKFYVFVGTANVTSVYTGRQAVEFLEKEGFSKVKSGSETELIGLPACRGKARGRVKIVRGLKDIRNCKGKIIICRETVIEYALMLKKNRALVTDLGGASSHAAVIARELMIPCIVNAKYATDIFKDGDVVEVDANKGIVKKL